MVSDVARGRVSSISILTSSPHLAARAIVPYVPPRVPSNTAISRELLLTIQALRFEKQELM